MTKLADYDIPWLGKKALELTKNRESNFEKVRAVFQESYHFSNKVQV